MKPSNHETMKNSYIPSFQCEAAFEKLGKNLRVARLRRHDSAALAAQRIGVSLSTYKRMEKGDPAVAAGAFFDALIVNGFETQVFKLGDPDEDELGKRLERANLPKRGKRQS